jgi:hypothetical protein
MQKYCHVPHGNRTQIWRDTTGVSGTLRSPAISLLNRTTSSWGDRINERPRLTRIKITCCRRNRIQSVCVPAIPDASRTGPCRFAMPTAPLQAIFGGRPRLRRGSPQGSVPVLLSLFCRRCRMGLSCPELIQLVFEHPDVLIQGVYLKKDRGIHPVLAFH